MKLFKQYSNKNLGLVVSGILFFCVNLGVSFLVFGVLTLVLVIPVGVIWIIFTGITGIRLTMEVVDPIDIYVFPFTWVIAAVCYLLVWRWWIKNRKEYMQALDWIVIGLTVLSPLWIFGSLLFVETFSCDRSVDDFKKYSTIENVHHEMVDNDKNGLFESMIVNFDLKWTDIRSSLFHYEIYVTNDGKSSQLMYSAIADQFGDGIVLKPGKNSFSGILKPNPYFSKVERTVKLKASQKLNIEVHTSQCSPKWEKGFKTWESEITLDAAKLEISDR